MEDVVEIDEECTACSAVYTLMFDIIELRGETKENTARPCTFWGILMEPYYDEEEM